MNESRPDRSEAQLAISPCRLCGGDAVFAFRKVLLGKYKVGFFRCKRCESLETEEPYWLDEAYSPAVDALDTGAAQRVLHCFALTRIVMWLLGCRTALDFGGGSGLLCRLLRDCGHDAYWYDRYTSPGYATGFVGDAAKSYDLVSSFEVVEHFPDPQADFVRLFAGRPGSLLLMTELYRGQSGSWPYIAPEEGQHIFFYSPTALHLIGEQYGYHLLLCHGFILFLREPPSKFRRWVLEKLVRHRIVRWAKLLFLAGPGFGAQVDYDTLAARVSNKMTVN